METYRTDNPICPYCGYITKDAWEINFGPGLEGDTMLSCDSCDKEYFCSRICDISYTTLTREVFDK